jgi:hypothetical protein
LNIFCRIFGHTWIHAVDEPKIAWNAGKDQVELHASFEGQTQFFEECVRCRERRPWKQSGKLKTAGDGSPPAISPP